MAGSINFLGSYSGIDQATIDQLMAAEKMPLVQLSNQKTSITAKNNAWKDVNTRLNSLFDKIKTLQSKDTFSAKKSSSTDENGVSFSTSKNSAVGSYKIHVDQLATSTTIISGAIAGAVDTTTELGLTGSFNIVNADGKDMDVEIVATDTLRTIMDKINAGTKETGIGATIINNRIVISDQKTGARGISLTNIPEGGDILDDLGLSDTASVTQGVNAKFTVNGIDVERDSNSVNDVILYTTINLNKEHSEGQFDTVNVSLDTSKVTDAVQDFVDQYNSVMSFIDDQLHRGDPEDATDVSGTLAGDSTLVRLQSTLRSYIAGIIKNPDTDIADFSQLGVTTIDKSGQLQFNSSDLMEALQKDPQNVMNFFTSKDSQDNDIGFASKIKTYIDSYISTTSGIIKGKTDSYAESLDDLNDRIDAFNDRMERKEQYYIKMYTALDVALAQAESQTSWLSSQIAAMGSNGNGTNY